MKIKEIFTEKHIQEYGWQVANGGTYYNELEDEDEPGEEGDLNETKEEIAIEDTEISLYHNPSNLEIKRLIGSIKNSGGPKSEIFLPFIILADESCLFWFPAILHWNIVQHIIGEGRDFIPCIGIISGRDIQIDVTDTISHTIYGGKIETIKKKILTNPYLNEHFRIDKNIGFFTEDDEYEEDEEDEGDLNEVSAGTAVMDTESTNFYFNPSPIELKHIIAINGKNNIPCIVLEKNKVLFWTPNSVFHIFVIKDFGRIGIEKTKDFIPCRIVLKGRDATIYISSNLSQTDYVDKPKEAVEIVRTNPYLKNTFHISRIETDVDDGPVYTDGGEQYNEATSLLLEAEDFMAMFNEGKHDV